MTGSAPRAGLDRGHTPRLRRAEAARRQAQARIRRQKLIIGMALAGAAALALLAFLDARAQSGKVWRNTYVLGQAIGGMDGAALDSFIEALDDKYRTTPIRVATTNGGFVVPGAELGVGIDHQLLRSHAMRAGRGGGPGQRLVGYLTSFVTKRHVAPAVSVDVAITEQGLRSHEGEERQEPRDPQLRVAGDELQIRAGTDGYGLAAETLAPALRGAALRGLPVTISANAVVLKSRYETADLERLLTDATSRTQNPLTVRVGDKGINVTPRTLRQWIQPVVENGQVRLLLDPAETIAGVRKLLGGVGTAPRDARIAIEGSQVVAVPSADGQRCCADDSIERMERALGSGQGVVRLDLKTIPPRLTTDDVLSYQVREPISTFTTKHVPGEERVRNIHHIADLLRGYVIPPGATFSVNETIGPRSARNGFVSAHVIEDGVYTENFGGGISQFATTLFNAAFFGGMDLVEYQSHSLWIRRYPFGREATLSYPRPDLKLRNSTPYGVMIWPTYTARSITVTLYSTRYYETTEGKQTIEKRGQCRIVFTKRSRVSPAGDRKSDTVRAAYRPKEGVDCEGNPTLGATTTTAKPRAQTTTSRPDGEESPTTKPHGENVEAHDEPASTRPASTRPASTEPTRTTTVAKVPSTEAPATTAAAPPDPAPDRVPVEAARPAVTSVDG